MNDRQPLLSICIPTYNRARYLTKALSCLTTQIRDENLQGEIEICISDNNSPDETPAVIADYKARFPELNWNTWRNPSNIGGFPNVFLVGERANGKYISFTGDDDTISPSSLKAMLDALETGANLIVTNSLPGMGQWQSKLKADDGTRRWFERMTEINAELGIFQISFLGNVVLNRSAFLRHRKPEQTLNAYPHACVAASILRESPALFVNRATYLVDDAARDWKPLQARFTCIDMASLQSDYVLDGARRMDISSVYAVLCRSVPRAVLHQRTSRAKGLNLALLLNCYRHSYYYRLKVFAFWIAARILPKFVLRTLLGALSPS